ncbi:ATP-binding protein [Gemmatimonas sp.]|uniref:sensor histidine kinase n=1 Tax=Gemmatimonas sp. TaxID=1962908 RepID=UPI00286A09EA|nr:ATP-binding protein [Gemmatimonas sp.]
MPMTSLVLASQVAAHGPPLGLSSAARDVFHVADVITALSYFAIATTLLVIVLRLRADLPFRVVFVLFGAFIVLCGATHVMSTLPLGAQRGVIETATMVATAAVSLLTAVVFPRFVPRIEALVRDAQLVRERERDKARADALAESNDLLVAQAAALNDANAQLTESLRERQRLEGHLRQVQKMELMGRLASGVAHDFNNLLTVIQGNVELVRDAIPSPDPAAAYVDEIDQATKNATELTRRLLAFSRKAPSRTERTTLDVLLARERRLLQRALHSGMHLEVHSGHADGFVQIDVNQVQQAILNLIVNARDATSSAGRSGGTVTVETGQVVVGLAAPSTSPPVAPGRYMTLSVRDEGTGISEDVRSHIFEPFFTTKDEGQGTGLGLAMIYEVMVQSGGGVQVESHVGRGSTFTLLLPRVA